jgi:CRISPR/Cas system-associated protein Csx1
MFKVRRCTYQGLYLLEYIYYAVGMLMARNRLHILHYEASKSNKDLSIKSLKRNLIPISSSE